jgi:hypothetical protein
MPDAAETLAARSLLSAAAVRERANQLLEHALAGRLDHFTVDLGRLEACADEVLATIEQNYPDLDIPFHARWRHFSAGDIDRWGAVASAVEWEDAPALARAAFDLAIVSVLLDAGAGPDWRYAEGRTGETYTRSEGLAVASFELVIGGAFSSRPEDPLRADADALASFSVTELARGFQVAADNPLVGLEGRAALINRLGQVVAAGARRVRAGGRPAPGRPLRRDRRHRAGRADRGAENPRGRARPPRPDLARAHRARAASTSATPGATASQRRRTGRTASCRSTSCRNGSRTRSSSRSSGRTTRWSTSTA